MGSVISIISDMDETFLLNLTNSVFRLSIPPELFKMRNDFCPHDGKIRPYWNCPASCPIFQNYYYRGLSCNGALDRYPDECMALMKNYNKDVS